MDGTQVSTIQARPNKAGLYIAKIEKNSKNTPSKIGEKLFQVYIFL